jgi:hypothetical protein
LTRGPHSRSGHFRGLGRLAAEATLGLTELVEEVHRTVSDAPAPLGVPPATKTTSGITGAVYGSVRGVTRIVGSGVDAALAKLAPLLGELPPSPRREALVAVLNGVLGDYLEASDNPLAIPMRLKRNGVDLPDGPGALAASLPAAAGGLVLVVHGLCMNDAGWSRDGHDHGLALERDLGLASLHLVYNTGRHVSTNGRELSGLLESFLANAPVLPGGVSIVGHSMGGLVARSALHCAAGSGHAWPALVRTVVCIGTPHHGAPLERLGNLFQAALGASPWSLPFARLGKIRSAGITDLRHGSLLDDDWEDHDRFERHGDSRRLVPLPAGISWCTVAGTKAKEATGPVDRLAGDGIVPVASALGHHRDPERTLAFAPGREWVAPGTGHFDLLSSGAVYERVRRWLADVGAGGAAAPSPTERRA